jgi:hypothetical protein
VLVALRRPGTLRASVPFAAALCEISGDFLIFVRLHTVGVSYSMLCGIVAQIRSEGGEDFPGPLVAASDSDNKAAAPKASLTQCLLLMRDTHR